MARRRPGRKRQKPVTLGNVIMLEVDNPLYSRAHDGDRTNPRTIQAAYNPRSDYVAFLYAKKSIDDAEKEAATMFRAAYEAMGGAGAMAIDYSREYVDGGKAIQTITDRHLQASKTLKQARLALGEDGYSLTLKLAGECVWPKEIAPHDAQLREAIGIQFRQCLDMLSVLWGKKKHRSRSFMEVA
jgi:hypothetical protein